MSDGALALVSVGAGQPPDLDFAPRYGEAAVWAGVRTSWRQWVSTAWTLGGQTYPAMGTKLPVWGYLLLARTALVHKMTEGFKLLEKR